MVKTTKILVLFVVLILVIPISGPAIPLPDTGQVKCYEDATVTEIACPQPGEPLFGQDAIYTINPPSYTKLDASGSDLPDDAVSWVMVRDNVTGLVWEVKQNPDNTPNHTDPHDADNLYTWYDSNPDTNGGDPGTPGEGTDTEDFIQTLNEGGFGGFSDWRLPALKELSSITHYANFYFAIDTGYFPNTKFGNGWWSSTTMGNYPEQAGGVSFYGGYVSPGGSKLNQNHARAVRGGKSENALVDNGDGSVTDSTTGLMWEQKTDDDSIHDRDNTYTWRQALAWIDNLNSSTYLGYSDWRLPNVRELGSIVDTSRENPAIDITYFPNTVSSYYSAYWSSTTSTYANYPYTLNPAYTAAFTDGSVEHKLKSSSYYVRAVRGGQNQLLDHLVISTPCQGCGWTSGSVREITWNNRAIPGNVKITLSRQGGKEGTFIETLADSTENDGSYTWTVSGPNSYNCMLKIEPLEPGYEDKGTVQSLFTIGNPSMSVNPPSHNFGNTYVGTSPPVKTFTVTNTGNGELESSSINITGQDSSEFVITEDSCSGQPLQPFDSCTVDVKFSPVSAGQKNAILAITSNDPNEPLTEVALTGLAVTIQLLVIPPDPFESSGYPGGPFSPSSKIYTLENAGDVTIDWTISKSAPWIDLSAANGSLVPRETKDVTVSTNTLASSLMLGTYQDTLIFVNATNGNGNTTRNVTLNVVKPPSNISCVLSSSDIVLGSPITVTGQITPAPSQSGAFVDVVLTPSTGQPIHRSVTANAQGEFSHDVPCGDIDQSGAWTVQTSWSGDEGLDGGTSVIKDLNVSKAESQVTLDVTSQAIKLGDQVSISGKFTPQPDCGGGLSAIPITLIISGSGGPPDIQNVQTDSQFGHFLLSNYKGFNGLGEWTVQASFAGNDAYLASSSDPIEVRVVETAGYGIVVQGKIASEEGLESHNKTAQFAYDKLMDRGLFADDIMYFNYDFGDLDRPEIDALPTENGVQNAITIWAMAKMNAKPANLYVVMLDHGLEDVFYIDPDIITATELNNWLNTLQSGSTGQAADQEIITILGFCRSGSFINELSAANRVIIASAAADESSYKGPLDDDGIREGEYFISEFFKSVSFGKTVKACFEEATALTEAFTSSGIGDSTNAPYYDDSLQHPLLDDNADGIGSNDLSESNSDGLLSESLFIGVSSITGNDPDDVMVLKTAEAQFLSVVENTVDLWARVDDNSGFSTIWVEVKPPDFVPVDTGGSGQAYLDLIKTATTDYNSTGDRWEWKNLGGFSVPGTYQVFYFAKDNDTGNVSPLMETRVYKAVDPNLPPDPFDLSSPSDGSEVLTTFILDWEDTTDPNGDSLTYTVLLSKGDDTFSDPIRKEGLIYSTYLMSPADGIEDLTVYYWKVQAVDEYGAMSQTGVWRFSTNNTNPVAAWIKGHVNDSTTGLPISDATVTLAGQQLSTELNGYYLATIPPGNYTVMASAPRYYLESYPGVVLPEGGIVTRDFILVPSQDISSEVLPGVMLLLLGE